MASMVLGDSNLESLTPSVNAPLLKLTCCLYVIFEETDLVSVWNGEMCHVPISDVVDSKLFRICDGLKK
jgi:hypothetical protein